jgi:hypothetical protein
VTDLLLDRRVPASERERVLNLLALAAAITIVIAVVAGVHTFGGILS